MVRVFGRVYQFVKQIPKGKVLTYGEIAKKLKINPQVVGFALHQNKNPKIPCHRVVNKEGRIAKNYAFGGAKTQREKLLSEGVNFKDNYYVDISQNSKGKGQNFK